ncbi:hypothetical protein M434DRAFT_207509 [Hypoxylon sp. CO27-5]|nr:hypothetical protein M434DRAFT_207509 [Hypoxylon sp. CO27-5]
MATAFVTNRPTEMATMGELDDVQSRQLCITALQDDNMIQPAIPSPQPSPRMNIPPPNPPFVFPARTSPSSAPSSFSRATGRRPQSAIELPGRGLDFSGEMANSPSRSPALPDFSFNPSANLSPETAGRSSRSPALPNFSFNPGATLGPDESLLSPPLSPPSPMSLNRNGHRRGGSEFVGGKPKAGQSITVMSTSPTRSESGFASPKLSPVDAHPRRGHAHRRSGAISSHDLTMILKPNPSSIRGSSAPTSPADFGEGRRNFPESKSESSKSEPPPQQATDEVAQEMPSQTNSQSNPSPKTTARTRVGFSDTLEFIPRPLSLVSTDTSSTMTVRPGHRVSESISSIISATNSGSTDRDQSGLVGSPVSRTKNDSRPSTAGAVLERSPSLLVLTGDSSSPRRRNSIPLLIGLPKGGSESPANSSPSKTPRRWSFFGLEPFATAALPIKSRSASSSSSETVEKNLEPAVAFGNSVHQISFVDAPTAPIAPLVMVTEPTQSEADPITTEPVRIQDDDASYPMIDLDAALGPFNTPTGRDPQWEEAQRAGAPPKRQLHSAAGLRGFSGPGMHYHRRAESAPEMPPFEAARFGIHRFGSTSTMADVFEEDEEDEDLSAKTPSDESASEARDGSADESESSSNSEDDASSTPTQEREPSLVSPKDIQQTLASVKRKGSGSSLDMQRPGSRMRTENPPSGLRKEIIAEEPSYVISRRDSNTPSTPGAPWAYDSEAPSPHQTLNSDIDPLETNAAMLPPPSVMPSTPYSMSYSSSFPSPRSPMSYDAHRISTAPSSVTDENYHALLMGEPGPELVRMSVDVPSLTSSNSTMTRDSTFFPGVQPRNMPFHDQRPASFTSTAFGRRRSSLVSLSRLISTAHGGERSKLSMEVHCETETEKKPKLSKSKRLSRMMQFWKTKDSTES